MSIERVTNDFSSFTSPSLSSSSLFIIYRYFQTAQHGFPHKPSAMAYDPKMKLMAIGTHSGAIKVSIKI